MKRSIRRSRGCQTCRNRRVKCDEKQPTCSQCERLGRICPGPRGPTVFIDENPRFEGSSASGLASKSPSKSPVPPDPDEASPVSPTIPDLGTLTRAQDASFASYQSPTRRWDINLPVETYYVSMLVNKFNIGTPGDGAGFSWLRPGLEATTEAELNVSHLFTRNLAQAFFGHFYNIPEVIAKAQSDYGKHLLMLKRELEIPGSIVSAHLFRGIMAAVMYECVALTNPEGWKMHISALAKIIQTRGPEAYRELPDRAVLGMCRAMIIADATQRRKRTFLADPEWRTAGPLSLSNLGEDALTDVQAELPGFLEDYDSIFRPSSPLSPGAKTAATAGILDAIVSLIQALFDWRWNWERQNSDTAYLVPCAPSSCIPRDPMTKQPMYPTLIFYTSIRRSHEICRYNSSLAVLFEIAHSLIGDYSFLDRVDRAPPLDMPYPFPNRSALMLPNNPNLNLYSVAAEHVRSVEYNLGFEKHISAIGLMLLLSLNLLYKALPPEDEQTKWIRKICGQIGTLSGWKVGSQFKPAQIVTKEMQWERYCIED